MAIQYALATSQSLDPMGSSKVHGPFRSCTDLVFDGFRFSARPDVGAARLLTPIYMGSWGRSSIKCGCDLAFISTEN
jgi:hypothetical protein